MTNSLLWIGVAAFCVVRCATLVASPACGASLLVARANQSLSNDAATKGGGSVKRQRQRQRRALEKLPEGAWGDFGVVLRVSATGAMIEYDCGHGSIDEPIKLNRAGRFDVRGTHEDETGGPATDISAVDESGASRPAVPDANSHPARYVGSVKGHTLHLVVTLTDTRRIVGTFHLSQGMSPRLHKCLSR